MCEFDSHPAHQIEYKQWYIPLFFYYLAQTKRADFLYDFGSILLILNDYFLPKKSTTAGQMATAPLAI